MRSKIGVARINTRLKSAHCFPLEWLYITMEEEEDEEEGCLRYQPPTFKEWDPKLVWPVLILA